MALRRFARSRTSRAGFRTLLGRIAHVLVPVRGSFRIVSDHVDENRAVPMSKTIHVASFGKLLDRRIARQGNVGVMGLTDRWGQEREARFDDRILGDVGK